MFMNNYPKTQTGLTIFQTWSARTVFILIIVSIQQKLISVTFLVFDVARTRRYKDMAKVLLFLNVYTGPYRLLLKFD